MEIDIQWALIPGISLATIDTQSKIKNLLTLFDRKFCSEKHFSNKFFEILASGEDTATFIVSNPEIFLS
jgi:hypothetical protein